jgi:hypothetical protein
MALTFLPKALIIIGETFVPGYAEARTVKRKRIRQQRKLDAEQS